MCKVIPDCVASKMVKKGQMVISKFWGYSKKDLQSLVPYCP